MSANNDVHFEYFSSVKSQKVEWLWYPYIPYGKITILQGDPGEGKSTFILNIAALLTKGKNMPDGYRVPTSQSVVYQTAEDNISDTVKPRLISAGADCNKVAYIVDEDNSLNLDDPRIEQVIEKTNAKLFILDPLQAYLTQENDLISIGRMRQKLKRIADIAEKYKCAIVIIGHMNKTSGEKNIYRGLGSIDITAIARSVLMIARDKNDSSKRYMFPVKSSLAPEGESIAFKFEKKKGLTWLGKSYVLIDKQDSIRIDISKTAMAKRLVLEILEDKDILSKDILQKLKLMGISERTANEVKRELGVSSYKRNGKWYWHLEDYYETEDGDNESK